VLHLRVVGQSLHIIIRSGRIASSRECQRFLSHLFFVLDATCPTRALVRVGFSDYKLLIHAANDNPFLLYYVINKINPVVIVVHSKLGT